MQIGALTMYMNNEPKKQKQKQKEIENREEPELISHGDREMIKCYPYWGRSSRNCR